MIDQYQFSCLQQGSAEWHKARLGYFSSSQVGLLMQSSRTKDQAFSLTGMGYIYDVAAKRRLLPAFLEGEGWQDYSQRTEVRSRAMQWGNDFESYARGEYESQSGNTVNECGFILHPTIEWFGDSPDGIICEDSIPVGALECKCPDSRTYIRYEYELCQLGKSLKEVNPDYYYQCLCHMECNKVEWCDFVVYDPMLKGGYLCIRLQRKDEVVSADISRMLEKVALANGIVNDINRRIK